MLALEINNNLILLVFSYKKSLCLSYKEIHYKDVIKKLVQNKGN
jgi:hypothetical protein